jgi:hypothetical protein
LGALRPAAIDGTKSNDKLMKIPFLPIHIFTEKQMVDTWNRKGERDRAEVCSLLKKNQRLLETIQALKNRLGSKCRLNHRHNLN